MVHIGDRLDSQGRAPLARPSEKDLGDRKFFCWQLHTVSLPQEPLMFSALITALTIWLSVTGMGHADIVAIVTGLHSLGSG
ncbi:hypothetical protein AB0L06_13710 [Spirillospora sp. NPDC052269]